MELQQQDIAIAKVCGTLKNPAPGLFSYPRYSSDLNAIHEAVKNFTPKQYRRFFGCLYDTTENEWHCSDDCHARFVGEAPAAQRAEAFLRTLDLWEE